MTRKVYADVDLFVLVPVRIQGSVILRTESRQDPQKIFQRILDGKPYSAVIEDCQVTITEIAHETVQDPATATLKHDPFVVDLDADTILARCVKPTIKQFTITDSK